MRRPLDEVLVAAMGTSFEVVMGPRMKPLTLTNVAMMVAKIR